MVPKICLLINLHLSCFYYELKLKQSTEFVICWKSKGLYKSKLLPLHCSFLPNITFWVLFWVPNSIQFINTRLVVEKNNYAAKNVNAYIAYDLDNWPKISLINFTLKNCLFGATNMVKNYDKEKCVYSGYGIAFDGKCSWSFGNGFAKNVVVFGVDNSSSSHTDNCKNSCFVLGEGDTFGIHGSFRAPEKSLVLILVKQSKILLQFALHS